MFWRVSRAPLIYPWSLYKEQASCLNQTHPLFPRLNNLSSPGSRSSPLSYRCMRDAGGTLYSVEECMLFSGKVYVTSRGNLVHSWKSYEFEKYFVCSPRRHTCFSIFVINPEFPPHWPANVPAEGYHFTL